MGEDYLEETGRIFDIQRFSIHDGPGIRTLVFLKGCLLRCKWCCNPESQNTHTEQIVFNGNVKRVGQDVSVAEVMETIEKDRVYYERSGGGVTLSGGECLAQADFATALLTACKESGITTAIETTASVKQEVVKRILPFVDVVLLDIKHMNPEKHKKYTGRDNQLILDNSKLIAQSDVELIIRVPVIPGFNDTKEEIGAIVNYVKTLKTIKEIHLLPYHQMGIDKYKGLGRTYTLADIKPPTDEWMEKLLNIVHNAGLKGQIGG